MLLVALLLIAAYIIGLIWEKQMNDRALASFKHVIHVNGIRGKTSVCRLLDAHLRGAGFKVFTKTTGTSPCIINTRGEEHAIRRFSPAHISEQLRIIRQAHREDADVFIVECMAVAPELQHTAQHEMVKSGIGVITNVRYDHLFEMGESSDAIAASLANTVPVNGVLFTADERHYAYFQDQCAERNSEAILCRTGEYARTENEAIVCAIGEHLGVPAQTFPAHAAQQHVDFGTHQAYEIGGITFLNLFSVNDPESTALVLSSYLSHGQETTFIYNNRADRPDRLLLFANYFFRNLPCKKVMVIGESKWLAKRILRTKAQQNVEIAPSWQAALARADSRFVVGVGNMKGQAYDMIESIEEGSEA